MGKLSISYISISEIKPYKNNPRINKNAVDIVASSIKEHGFQNPILIDKSNVIVAGHTRKKAIEKLRKEYGDEFKEKRTAINEKGEEYKYDFIVNLKEVPTIKADDLTEQQVKAFRIMDNKSQEFSDWDMEKLQTEFKDLKNLGVDLELTGIEPTEDIEKIKTQEEEIKPFTQTHILLSFPPEKFSKVSSELNKILKIEGVEYEQSSN